MYHITVTWLEAERTSEEYGTAVDYEVKDGVLTVALSRDHDVVIPLGQVKRIDVVRERSADE